MKKIDFNHGWTYKSLTWEDEPHQVTLPHDAMISSPRNESSTGEGNIGWYVGGDWEYCKTFSMSADEIPEKAMLEFEGVSCSSQVYLNGEEIASRPYAYTNFYADISGKILTDKENVLRVVAHNSKQPNSRWYQGSGIYRPVYLFTSGLKYIPEGGIRVSTLSTNPAKICVSVKTSLPGKVKLKISECGKNVICAEADSVKCEPYTTVPAVFGKSAQTISPAQSCNYRAELTITVPDAKLWSCDKPNLYTLRVSFADDEATVTFGIRSLQWNPQEGMTINGERVILRGACIHHDNGILGAAAYPEADDRRIRLLKENGYNAIRSAHNPCSKSLLDACDKYGVLVMDEFADCWYIHKNKYDYVNNLATWWQDDLREMVEKDYCHPSVIMYSTGNEVAETSEKKGIAFTGEMTQYLHSLDDTRPVSCGINIFFNFLYSIGLGVYSDDKAEALSTESQKPKKKKHVGSDFYNTVAALLGCDFMKICATLPFCDWKTRDAFANMDVAGYNYGILRYKHDLKKYPDRLILGSETFCSDAYSFWEKAKKNNRIIGDFVWSGMDYIGETGDGAAEFADYSSENPEDRMTGGNGRIDLLGKPKAEAKYTRVALEREAGPYIAVMPVYEKDKPRFTGWQLTKAVESWAWEGCDGMKARVEVYARAEKVALMINGKVVGEKKPKKCRAIFDVKYESGKVEAVAYDKAGNKIGAAMLESASKETKLNVLPECAKVKEGGIAYVPISYTDDKGIWKPEEKHTVSVTVEHGTLAALGNACPYFHGNYTCTSVPTYFGEAMAIVRADGTGDVKVTVTDEKQSVSATISCAE